MVQIATAIAKNILKFWTCQLTIERLLSSRFYVKMEETTQFSQINENQEGNEIESITTDTESPADACGNEENHQSDNNKKQLPEFLPDESANSLDVEPNLSLPFWRLY